MISLLLEEDLVFTVLKDTWSYIYIYILKWLDGCFRTLMKNMMS